MMGTHAKIRSIFLAIVVVISHAEYSVGDKVALKYDLEDVDGIDGIISIMGTDAIVIPKGWPLTVIEIPGMAGHFDRLYRVSYQLDQDREIMNTTIPEGWLAPFVESGAVMPIPIVEPHVGIERNVSADEAEPVLALVPPLPRNGSRTVRRIGSREPKNTSVVTLVMITVGSIIAVVALVCVLVSKEQREWWPQNNQN
eukprot:206696_1